MNLTRLRRATPEASAVVSLASAVVQQIRQGTCRVGDMQDQLRMVTTFQRNRVDRALQYARKRGWVTFDTATKTWRLKDIV